MVIPVEEWRKEFIEEYNKLERKLAMQVIKSDKKELKK
jgi:hypothetical protein